MILTVYSLYTRERCNLDTNEKIRHEKDVSIAY